MKKAVVNGNLQFMSLQTLITDNCNEQRTCCVVVQNGTSTGKIFLKSGNIIHATMGAKIGEQALHKILNLNKGTFELFSDKKPSEHTINKSVNKLLLESTRIIDENSRGFDWGKFDLKEKVPMTKTGNKLENFITALRLLDGISGVAVYSVQSKTFKNDTNLDLNRVTILIKKTKKIGKLFQAVRLNYAILHDTKPMILINYGLNSLILTVEKSQINDKLINKIRLLIKQYK